MSTTPTYPSAAGPTSVRKRIADSDSTNLVDLLDNSGGATAVKIEALGATTDNTADRIVKLWLLSGGVTYLLGSMTIPDLSGTNGATDPRVNLMALPYLATAGADGVPCFYVGAGEKLQASLDSALASGKYLWVVGRGIAP